MGGKPDVEHISEVESHVFFNGKIHLLISTPAGWNIINSESEVVNCTLTRDEAINWLKGQHSNACD